LSLRCPAQITILIKSAEHVTFNGQTFSSLTGETSGLPKLNYFRDLFIYKLTLEAQKCLASSDLSRREIVRRLGTSASQFYRLLDQTNCKKSVAQLLALLNILGCEVDLVVRQKRSNTHAYARPEISGM
jgi:hypothetical protein